VTQEPRPQASVGVPASPLGGADSTQPAGFWRRYLAYCLDWTVLAAILYWLLRSPIAEAVAAARALNSLLQEWLLTRLLANAEGLPSPLALAHELLADASLRDAIEAADGRLTQAITQALLITIVTAAVYFIGFEASPWRATPGKRLLDLSVVESTGRGLGWGRASLRFFAGSLSWLSLNLGHALAGWRTDGRALHDLIAGTWIVTNSPMPRWGRWLLWAQLVAVLAVLVGMLARLLWMLAQLATAGAL
jgi:uncharacterized RDD family membrane protein YckC